MNKEKKLAIARISLGAVTVIAVCIQLISSISFGRDIGNFFSFFTIESNILAACLLIAMGTYALIKREDKNIAFIRGAITLYMTMTGIIYMMFLSGNEVALQTTIPVVNFVLHYLIPVVILLDWIVFPPKTPVTFRKSLAWLAFPALYLLYSLIRGAMTEWYPYPFINPIINGWPNVIGMSLSIAVGTIGLIGLLTLRTKKRRHSRTL
jgi:hypothetical protein